MKKRLHLTLLTLTATLLLSACGSGDSTPVDQNTTQTPTSPSGTGIAVCSGTDQGFQNATVLKAGKVIKGLENNPSIRLWHLSDGMRKACVKSGKVEVL